MNTTLSPGIVYDAPTILGFSPQLPEEPAPGEIVIRYGGWSLQELRECTAGKKLMDQQDWYDIYTWSIEKLPPGIYRLRVPVPDSNRKTVVEQKRMLPQGETVAPVVLVATAILAHHLQTGEDVLKTDFIRCKERDADGDHVELYWSEGLLYVDCGHDSRSDDAWVS